jgi:hypothetical protein
VIYELPSAVPVGCKPHSVNNIIKPCFEKLKKHLTGYPLLPLCPFKGAPELAF